VATKKQRQRQLAREAHQRRMSRQVQHDRRNKQIAVSVIVAVLVLGVAFGVSAIAGFFPHSAKPAAAASTFPKPTPIPTPSATPSAAAAMVNGKCVYTASGTASKKVSLPPAKPDAKAHYVATIKTNRGTIVVDLLNSKAPCTVNSFVSLIDQKFYNKTPCHRLVTSQIYVLQCGDPTGTGQGGPGYVFANENLTGAKYTAGTVAMANTGAAVSNGSQFFFVYKDTALPPNYTPFGTVASGLNIIQNVAKAGSDNSNGANDGHPKEKVQIESVTIKKT